MPISIYCLHFFSTDWPFFFSISPSVLENFFSSFSFYLMYELIDKIVQVYFNVVSILVIFSFFFPNMMDLDFSLIIFVIPEVHISINLSKELWIFIHP